MAAALQLQLEAFVRLSKREREMIAGFGRSMRETPARRDIVREGERPRAVHLMLEGWACRYRQLPDGRRQIVSFFIPGDLCDANHFLLERMDHSIGAITRIRYAEIASDDFQKAMDSSPRFTRAIWWQALVTAAIQREWTANIGQRSALERLAHLFCEMFLKLKIIRRCIDGSCEWPLTQNDLADATGLTSVHVNRTLQELRRERLIELQGKQLTVPDFEALSRVAMFNPGYLHLEREGSALDAND